MINQRKDSHALERHRAKTLGGLLTRLAVEVVAVTAARVLNLLLDRPLWHLVDLVV